MGDGGETIYFTSASWNISILLRVMLMSLANEQNLAYINLASLPKGKHPKGL